MSSFINELLAIDTNWAGEEFLNPELVACSGQVRPSVLLNVFEQVDVDEVFTVRSLVGKLEVIQQYAEKTQVMFIHSTLLCAIRSNHPDIEKVTPQKYRLIDHQ